jgi:hypothetical protein
VWRLLQGMKGVYEKYGYLSPKYTRDYIDKMMEHRRGKQLALIGEGAIGERAFDIVRRLATTKPLKDFKEIDYYFDIVSKFEWHYPDVFTKVGGVPTYEEKTIAELISNIPYAKTWFTMRWGEGLQINIFETLFMIVLGVPFESVGKLTLDVDSALWRKWDSELKFLSAEPFDATTAAAGAGAGAAARPVSFGGARLRRTRRRRRSQRSKKRRANQ